MGIEAHPMTATTAQVFVSPRLVIFNQMAQDCDDDFSAFGALRQLWSKSKNFSPRLSKLCKNAEHATRACCTLEITSVIEFANGWDSISEALVTLKETGISPDGARTLLNEAEAICFVQVHTAAKFGLSRSEMQSQRPPTHSPPCSSGGAWPLPELIVPYASSDIEKTKKNNRCEYPPRT